MRASDSAPMYYGGMPAGYDSWLEDAKPDIPNVERGHGYAIGGATRPQTIRVPGRWRAQLAQHMRLVAFDMLHCLLPVLLSWLAIIGRHTFGAVGLFIAATSWLESAIWFRVRRMEHEKRPR